MNILPWQKELIDHLMKKYDEEEDIKNYLMKLEKQTGYNLLLESNYYYICIRNKKLRKIFKKYERS